MTLWDNLLTKASTNKFKNTLKWLEKRIPILSIWLKRKKNLKVKWNKEFQMLILKLFRVNMLVWSNNMKKSLRIKLMSSKKWLIIWKILTKEIINLFKEKSLLLTKDLQLRSGKEISIKRRELISMFKWISKCSWPISKTLRKKFRKDKKKLTNSKVSFMKAMETFKTSSTIATLEMRELLSSKIKLPNTRTKEQDLKPKLKLRDLDLKKKWETNQRWELSIFQLKVIKPMREWLSTWTTLTSMSQW